MCLATHTNESEVRVCFLNRARLFVTEFRTAKCLLSLADQGDGEVSTRGGRKQDEEAK
jgi:hypothetical protein